MPNLSLAEVSRASRNAMLSAKVYKTIRRARRGEPLDDREQSILSRGANLLSEVVQGSLLIDRKPLEQGLYTDLKAYRHALSALVQLQQRIEEEKAEPLKDVTRVLRTYRDDLSSLSQGRKVSDIRLSGLAEFFRVLSEFFSRDVQSPTPVRQEPFRAVI
ncbi:MAG TPA: hypothetical protein VNM67_22220 [Thermoanaerobaculia bacterium]|jgi:hypothetical protein|nr:hypothetical protein [Thermoanaerobaculia bacterium]